MAKSAKPPKPASTQSHIPIAQIRDSLVIMKDGTLRTILVVSSVNFALKSQQEQDAIIYQFQNFLNSLNYPIQIMVQSRQLDLNTYLQGLADKARDQQNELLRFQMVDYIDFVSRLITLANIMEKRFFVVVPHNTTVQMNNGPFGFLFGGGKSTPHYNQQQFDKYRTELNERANIMISGLASMGLRAVQLNTQEIVEFYYSLYNPEEAIEEKLVDIDDLRASVIQKAPNGGLNG